KNYRFWDQDDYLKKSLSQDFEKELKRKVVVNEEKVCLYKEQIMELKKMLAKEEHQSQASYEVVVELRKKIAKQHTKINTEQKMVKFMGSQLVCNGCRNILVYPRGATNVCCALCNTVTSVPPPGMDMSQLYCGGCTTLLMYTRGATSVRCSCCHTINLVPVLESNQVIHCTNCRTTLMYPYGASSVKCAICRYITNVSMTNGRLPIPVQRPNGTANSGTVSSTSSSMPHSQSQTVVVENPMSVDSSGKLVSNVVVGVTTEKK
ncbi:Protein LSD1 isoform D, partial [Glycine soja]